MTVISVLTRFFRFAVAGVAATLVHTAIALPLMNEMKFSAGTANGLAFCVASAFSYVLNARWSFASTIETRSLRRFMIVAIGGAAMASFVARTAERAGLPPAGGVLLVVALVPPITLLLHTIWTFRGTETGQTKKPMG